MVQSHDKNSNPALTASSTSSQVGGDSNEGRRDFGNQSSKLQSGTWDQLESLDFKTTRSTDVEDTPANDDDNGSVWVEEHWPRSKPGDSSDEEPVPQAQDRNAMKSSSGSRPKKGFFRSLIKKFSKSFRYGDFGNTKQEQDRNIIQHHALFEVLGERLYLAPVSRPKAVLDIGTGPGIWALKHPDSHVIGIDKDPIKAPYSVRNCHFKVMDALEEWSFATKFDLIHWRMLGDVGDRKKLIRKCFDNLNPGSWLEMTEWIVYLHSPNHSLENTSFRKWNLLFIKGLQNLGGGLYDPYEFQELFQNAGFERIRITKNCGLTNACYPGKQLQKVGNMMTENWLAILEPFSMPVFVAGLGWPPERVKSLLNDVRREIGDTRYHSFMTLLTVYGRKPRDGGESSTSASLSSASKRKEASTSSIFHAHPGSI